MFCFQYHQSIELKMIMEFISVIYCIYFDNGNDFIYASINAYIMFGVHNLTTKMSYIL